VEGFLLAFLGVLLTSIGGRDQMLMARLSARLGPSSALLATGVGASAASAFTLSFAGVAVAGLLPEAARWMLVALALGLSGIELALPLRRAQPQEPTRSLGAIGAVLLLYQAFDAARFLVFALAIASASAPLAGLGGALGGSAALAIGWSMGEELEARWPLRGFRKALSALLIGGALALGLYARLAL